MRVRLRGRVPVVLAIALLATAALLWAQAWAGVQDRPLSIAQLRATALRDPLAWGGRTVRVRATAYAYFGGFFVTPRLACGYTNIGQWLADGPDPNSPSMPVVSRNDSLRDTLGRLPGLGWLTPDLRITSPARSDVYSVHAVVEKCSDGWKVHAEMLDVQINSM